MKILTILVLGLTCNLNAQCIQFSYDPAGDRTARNICPPAIIAPPNQTIANQNIENKSIVSDDNDIIIFPNPSSGIFEINTKNWSSNTNILIADVLGRVIIRKNFSSNKIDLTHYPSGRYFISFIDGDKHKVITVLKE